MAGSRSFLEKEEAGMEDLFKLLDTEPPDALRDVMSDKDITEEFLFKTDARGYNPLHKVIEKGYRHTLTYLIELLESNEQNLLIQQRILNQKTANHQNTPLHLAVGSGDIEIIDILVFKRNDEQNKVLRSGIDLNAQNKNGDTPLHLAVKKHYIGVLNKLFESPQGSIDANLLNHQSLTPLELAVKIKFLYGINQLAEVSDLNLYNREGLSIVHTAIEIGHIKTLKALLFRDNEATDPFIERTKISVNALIHRPHPLAQYHALHLAIFQKKYLIIELLLKRSDLDLYNNLNPKQLSPTDLIVSERLVSVLFPLFLKRVDFEIKHSGLIPDRLLVESNPLAFRLNKAIWSGEVSVIKEILRSKDSEDIVNKKNVGHIGWTPLHMAVTVHTGNSDMLEALLHHLAIDLNVYDEQGLLPLHRAVGVNNYDASQALLFKDSNEPRSELEINTKMKSGLESTALHIAVSQSSIRMVHLLLERADIDTKILDNLGLSALHSALYLENSNHLVMKLLYKPSAENSDYLTDRKNINVNVQTQHSMETALHIAIRKGLSDVALSLINRKDIKVNLYDVHGYMPVHLAVKYGRRNILRFLFDVYPKPFLDFDHVLIRIHHLLCINQFTKQDGYTPLHLAIQYNQEEIVKYFLSIKEVDLTLAVANHNKEYHSFTPLHIAAEQGHEKIIQLLIPKLSQDDLGARTTDGSTAFHIAAKKGRYSVVQILIEEEIKTKSSRINLIDHSGYTALHRAIEYGFDKVALLLIDAPGIDINCPIDAQRDLLRRKDTPLHLAVKYNRAALVARLLFDRRIELTINTFDREGYTALHIAVKENRLEIVKFLIDIDHTVDLLIKGGPLRDLTVFHLAAEKGSPHSSRYEYSVMGYLLQALVRQKGHDFLINALKTREEGWSPLHVAAASQNDNNAISLLIRTFPSTPLNEKDKHGFTPFHLAVANNHLKVIQFLISIVDLNTINAAGLTPLHTAVSNKNIEIIRMLLEANQAIFYKKTQIERYSVLHLGALQGSRAIFECLVHYLKENKSQSAVKRFINARSKKGRTALHLAIQEGKKNIVQVLLNQDADYMILDKRGKTALQLAKDFERRYASDAKYKDILRLLKTKEAFQESSAAGMASHSFLGCVPLLRQKRSLDEAKCQFYWEDVDQFNDAKNKRNIAEIKINSDQFMAYLAQEASEDNRNHLIRLANQVKNRDVQSITGSQKNKVNEMINHQMIVDHLRKVAKISALMTQGLMYKNIVAEIIQGQFEEVAFNIGWITANQGLSKLVQYLDRVGESLVFSNKQLLGKMLKLGLPFLSRITISYSIYHLANQIKIYQQTGEEEALINIIGDSINIGVDVVEVSVEVAEILGIVEGVSAVLGPIGMGVIALVFLGTEAYIVARQVSKINAIIPLTTKEKWIEGLRTFIGMQPEPAIKELLEKINKANILVEHQYQYLTQHPDIKRSIFSFPTEESIHESMVDHRLPFHLNKIILLNQEIDHWGRFKPKNIKGMAYFCLEKGKSWNVPQRGGYACQNAIGIEDTSLKAGDYTLIDLGFGNDTVIGLNSNIVLMNTGVKRITGGAGNDIFIFEGEFCGGSHIQGNQGTNMADFTYFAPTADIFWINLNAHIAYLKNSPLLNTSVLEFFPFDYEDVEGKYLKLTAINDIKGRKNKADTIVLDCTTKRVDGQSGYNSTLMDHLFIFSNYCRYHLSSLIRPYTVLYNSGVGQFDYIVLNGGSGKAEMHLDSFSNETQHNIFFNYTLADLYAIYFNHSLSTYHIRFSFIDRSFLTNWFNITVQYAHFEHQNILYQLNDLTEIKINPKHIYIIQNSNHTTMEIIQTYPQIADRLNATISVYSVLENATFAIGSSKHDVLQNDADYKSYLIGNRGENIFIIQSADSQALNVTLFPLPEIILYYLGDQKNDVNTLYLNQIRQQIEQALGIILKATINAISNQPNDLCVSLQDHSANKTYVNIILKDIKIWHDKLHLIIRKIPKKIHYNHPLILLKPVDLVFPPNKTIVFIQAEDIAMDNRLIMQRKITGYEFYRKEKNLRITNALLNDTDSHEVFTIELQNFYKERKNDTLPKKMHTLMIQFENKAINLKKEIDQINHAKNITDRLIHELTPLDNMTIHSLIIDPSAPIQRTYRSFSAVASASARPALFIFGVPRLLLSMTNQMYSCIQNLVPFFMVQEKQQIQKQESYSLDDSNQLIEVVSQTVVVDHHLNDPCSGSWHLQRSRVKKASKWQEESNDPIIEIAQSYLDQYDIKKSKCLKKNNQKIRRKVEVKKERADSNLTDQKAVSTMHRAIQQRNFDVAKQQGQYLGQKTRFRQGKGMLSQQQSLQPNCPALFQSLTGHKKDGSARVLFQGGKKSTIQHRAEKTKWIDIPGMQSRSSTGPRSRPHFISKENLTSLRLSLNTGSHDQGFNHQKKSGFDSHHTNQPLSRVTAPVQVESTLFALNVWVRTLTGQPYYSHKPLLQKIQKGLNRAEKIYSTRYNRFK